MEAGAGVSLTLDCEDMFKEITKKLYGEEATVGVVGVEFPAAERDLDDDLRPEEHITAWGLAALMQNGFPPPGILQANFTPRTDPTAEDRWTAAEEPLAWAHSRVASYNPAQRLFKCCECECVGFLARVAEHWLGTHSQARAFQCPLAGCGFASGWARGVRSHLARDHHSDPAAADHLLRDNPALADLTRYLTRLKAKVEAARDRGSSGGSGGGGGGSGGGGVGGRGAVDVSEPDGAGAPHAAAVADGAKRYACHACPYATDRRDLFTRHENIHRDEKPFHCYLCQKQFNRADHVKKHFLRMHRDQPYDLNRIRRSVSKPQPQQLSAAAPPPASAPGSHPPTTLYYTKQGVAGDVIGNVGTVGTGTVGTISTISGVVGTLADYRVPPVKLERVSQQSVTTKVEVSPAPPAPPPSAPLSAPPAPPAAPTHKPSAPQTQSSQSHHSPARRKGERRYACCYCAWSGADNWCLKRHLNTHLKPFACSLCEYKAARAERLATHVHKVHNKKACAKCPFLADDQHQLAQHLREAHHIESRSLKVPVGRAPTVVGFTSSDPATAPPQQQQQQQHAADEPTRPTQQYGAGGRRREARAGGAARLFGYLEASDGSGDEYDAPLEYGGGGAGGGGTGSVQHFTRDKENAAPSAPSAPPAPALHHSMHHDHCLRY